MKFVTEIFKLREIMSPIASRLPQCAVKFARRQHLFNVAVKHWLTSIRIFCRVLLPYPCSNFPNV